jgi:hypothetical protein
LAFEKPSASVEHITILHEGVWVSAIPELRHLKRVKSAKNMCSDFSKIPSSLSTTLPKDKESKEISLSVSTEKRMSR